MRYAAEPFARWHVEAAPLFRAHWQMVGRDKDLVRLDMDLPRWVRLDGEGLVTSFTARIGEKLCGYAMYLTAPSLNYRGHVFAYCHAIYIDPPELEGFLALRFPRFIEFCDARLKERGCTKAVMHMKLTHNFLRMLEPMGYEAAELIAERVL